MRLECRSTKYGPRDWLVFEVVGVVVAVVTTMVVSGHIGWTSAWYVAPTVLVAGAVVPTAALGRSLADLGLQMGRPWLAAQRLCVAAVALVCIGLSGVFLLTRLNVEIPLRVTRPEQAWSMWVVFQFAYVAVPEELFFRGYLVSNTSRLLQSVFRYSPRFADNTAVILAAGVFALAHVLVFWNPAALLTFVPGLIFGWLFVTTKSLIGPVVLHGGANIGFALIADMLT